MAIKYLETQRAGGPEVVESASDADPQPEPQPAANMRLVRYATDEVEWYVLDEYPLAY
jgi:hypothetical protein